MVSKKSLSMRLKIHRTAAVTPSLANAPKLKAPTRLKSGLATMSVGMIACPGRNPAFLPHA